VTDVVFFKKNLWEWKKKQEERIKKRGRKKKLYKFRLGSSCAENIKSQIPGPNLKQRLLLKSLSLYQASGCIQEYNLF
jgi:hypothetical protein